MWTVFYFALGFCVTGLYHFPGVSYLFVVWDPLENLEPIEKANYCHMITGVICFLVGIYCMQEDGVHVPLSLNQEFQQ